MFVSIYNWLCKKIGAIQEEVTPQNGHVSTANPWAENLQDTDKTESLSLKEAQLMGVTDKLFEAENSILGKRKNLSINVESRSLIISSFDDDSIVKSPALEKKVKSHCIEYNCATPEKEKLSNVSTERVLNGEKSQDSQTLQDQPVEFQFNETNIIMVQETQDILINNDNESKIIKNNPALNSGNENKKEENQEDVIQIPNQNSTESETKAISQGVGQKKLDNEEIVKRRALKKQRKLLTSKINNKTSTLAQKFDQKIILQIFDGEIIYSSKVTANCSFYTYETYLDIIMFPALKQTLLINGMVEPAELLPFLEQLNQKTTLFESKKVLFGWISAKDNQGKRNLQVIADQMKTRDKFNVLNYPNSMIIYILSPSMLNEEIQRKLKWIPPSSHGGPEIEATLLFAVYLKKPLEDNVERIEPEFVGISLEPRKCQIYCEVSTYETTLTSKVVYPDFLVKVSGPIYFCICA